MSEAISVKKIEKGDGLTRKILIEIPAAAMTEKLDKEAKQLAKTKSLKGYRRGKVPLSVIKKMFGDELRRNILVELMEQAFEQALQEKDLRIASNPVYEEVLATKDDVIAFSASFEVLPDIKLPVFKKLKVTCIRTEVNDEAVNHVLERFRRQLGKWKVVERKAQKGDLVNMDYVGKLKGEAFDGGTARSVDLELGSKQFIEGFEEGLIGLKAGDEKDLKLKFPKTYHAEEVAGQKVTFEIKIHAVKSCEPAALDESFVREIGIASGKLEDLQTELLNTMVREAEEASKHHAKRAIFVALREQAKFDLPNALVDQEIHRMRHDIQQQFIKSGVKQAKIPELPRDILEVEAKQRVKTGLLLAETIKQHELKVDEERVDEAIVSLAHQYQDANEVIQWYNDNIEERRKLASVILEDQVVDLIRSQAKITEKFVDYEELLNLAN